jgi:uncharacterized protein
MPQPLSIDAWGGGGFRVAGEWFAGSLLILGGDARPWRPVSVEDLQVADFAQIIAVGPQTAEFILLGAGSAAAPPPRMVREAIEHAGLGLELMASPAAARLHNVLSAEGRRFATALIAV